MKKRRGKRYHTGSYTSTKTGATMKYRSSWELDYMKILDADPSVVSYEYETIVIAYISNYSSGKVRHYIPDFKIDYADNTKVLVEIKPSKKLEQKIVNKKRLAAEHWCKDHQMTLRIITEKELATLKTQFKEYL
jgi:hypothetical protein